MSSLTQTESGAAWEYGLARQFADILNHRTVLVVNPARRRAQDTYDLLTGTERLRVDNAAKNAVTFLLAHDSSLARAIRVELQSSSAGRYGDVRDIMICLPQGITVGVSAKHRHGALKHPRLSATIDFGDGWYGVPCSADYWGRVLPVFRAMERIEGQLWRNVSGKVGQFYQPILDAFIEEVKAQADPAAMLRYLLGRHDFYKVIKTNGNIVLQSFNMDGTLKWGRRLPMPTEVVRFAHKPDTKATAVMYLTDGWQLSFRLHNASARVEKSFKFDVQLIGNPQVLSRQEFPYG